MKENKPKNKFVRATLKIVLIIFLLILFSYMKFTCNEIL